MWPFKRRKIAEQIAPPKRSAFTTDLYPALAKENGFNGLDLPQPVINGVGMDSFDSSVPSFKGEQVYGVPESQAAWYASQMFIGNNMCAVIAKHWLVDKACNMPARDAIRQGYDIDCDDDDDRAISKKLRKRDRKYRISHQLKELVHFGRVYGGRLALFVVETSNPKEWYENPFNLDGVTKGTYKGIKQIDPQWVTPDLADSNIQDPASMDFYEPTYYVIGGRKYHKSHFIKFVPFPVPNVLKPLYNYFGVSVPERIYERVYASERTANEAPQLAMTKRLLTIGMADPEGADKSTIQENMLYFMEMRDNYGVQVMGIRCVVYHKNKAWQSKVENNAVEPAAGAAWIELKADLSAGDINVYTKTESDKRFQPLGNYVVAGYSYSKAESDTNYQPKGNYAPAGNYALKGESYTKTEGDGRYQPKGSYQPSGDYATNTALNNGLNTKLNTSSIVQSTGTSTANVMSQKAVTDALQNAVNLNTIYPIGIVVWFAQNKNPNTLFPSTKWQYIGENKTIRLASSNGANVLQSGGSDTVTLTEAQMPVHSHAFSATTSNFDYGTKSTNSAGAHTHGGSGKTAFNGAGSLYATVANGTNTNPTTASSGAHTHTVAIGAHTHTVTGTTSNKGNRTAITVTNAHIMLMGWYRTS